jgi:nucleoid DNA-binding protein/DNA-directed RNA polymerase subunit RPC12/RpoP
VPTNKTTKAFTRSRLIKELSWSCELPQTSVKLFLEKLVEIAKREAKSTFVIPGLCKLDVVRRKSRKVRNPRTGQTIVLPEREALRISASRALKMAVARVIEPETPPAATTAPVAPEEKPAATAAPAAPVAQTAPVVPPAPVAVEAQPEAVAPEAPSEAPAAAEEPAPATEEQTAPVAEEQAAEAPAAAEEPAPAAEEPAPAAEEPAPATEEPVAEEPVAVDPNKLISFRCPRCHQEVEATGDMVGVEAECPTCGNPITVPAESEPGTMHGAPVAGEQVVDEAAKQTVSSQEAESMSPDKLKWLTIRIDVDSLNLGDSQGADAPAGEQMISFVCPACKQEIEASADMIGESTACPNCGAPLVVPSESASNTLHASQDADPRTLQAMKGRTMRIDMGDDF